MEQAERAEEPRTREELVEPFTENRGTSHISLGPLEENIAASQARVKDYGWRRRTGSVVSMAYLWGQGCNWCHKRERADFSEEGFSDQGNHTVKPTKLWSHPCENHSTVSSSRQNQTAPPWDLVSEMVGGMVASASFVHQAPLPCCLHVSRPRTKETLLAALARAVCPQSSGLKWNRWGEILVKFEIKKFK